MGLTKLIKHEMVTKYLSGQHRRRWTNNKPALIQCFLGEFKTVIDIFAKTAEMHVMLAGLSVKNVK